MIDVKDLSENPDKFRASQRARGADESVVDALQLVRLPYHLSSLTQAAARTALAHTDALLATVDAVKEQRDRIVAALPGMGLTSVASDANFVLFGQ